MSVRDNLQLVRDMYAALNAQDLDAHDAYWHEDMIWHGPPGFGDVHGLAAFKRDVMVPFYTAFPDYFAKNDIEFADDTWVAATGYLTGTHLGPYLGYPATGRKMRMRFSDFWLVKDGKLAENWVMVDHIDVFRQLGLDLMARIRRPPRADRTAAQPLLTFEEVDAELRQEVQVVDEDPVLRELVSRAAVEVDDAHLRLDLAGRGESHVPAFRLHPHGGIAEEPAVAALGELQDVAVVGQELQPVLERPAMLLDVALVGVGGADPGRSPPQHVVVPVELEIFLQGPHAGSDQAIDHPLDEGHRGATLLLRVRIEEESVLGLRPRGDDGGAGALREHPEPGLVHHAHDVDEQGRLGDPAFLDAVELGVAQEAHLAGRPNAEPRGIEQAEEVPHAAHPLRPVPVHEVASGEEDVLAALQRHEGALAWLPEHARDRFRAALLVERVHPPPVPVVGRETGQHLRARGGRRPVECAVEVEDEGFRCLEVGHARLRAGGGGRESPGRRRAGGGYGL